MSCIKNRLRRLPDVVHEVIGSVLRRHAGINKADQVRDRVIAEDQVHLGLVIFEAIDGVELCSQVQPAGGHCRRVEKEMPRLRPSTSSSVAIHFTPRLCASAKTSSETLPSDGHTPCGRIPNTCWWRSSPRRSCSRASSGWRKRFCGSGRPGRGNRSHVGIANQGQDGVIERRGRNLDQPALGGVSMGGQNFGQQFLFPRDHEASGLPTNSHAPF